MKKWWKGIAVGVLALGLAACGGDEEKDEPKAENEQENKTEQTEQVDDTKKEEKAEEKLTAGEVFDKATKASEEVESMTMTMKTAQEMDMPEAGINFDSTMDATIEMIEDPLAMYQKLDMGMEEGNMSIEMYLVEDGLFMYEPQADQWMKLPKEEMGDLEEIMEMTKSSEVDLDEFAQYKDEFELVEEDDQYILRMKGAGETFEKMIQDQVEETGILEDADESAQALKDMTINEVDYELFIDKETFQTKAYNMYMDIDMEVEGQTMKMKQDIQVEVDEINNIDEIVVPDEVKENAVEA